MKTSSAKSKGRRACQEVKTLLLAHHTQLEPDDIEVTSSGAPGRDVKLSPAAQRAIGKFAIEVKNVEKLNVRQAYEQAQSHMRNDEIPILFHTRNRNVMLVTLSAFDFLQLIQTSGLHGADGSGRDQKHYERLPEAEPKKGP